MSEQSDEGGPPRARRSERCHASSRRLDAITGIPRKKLEPATAMPGSPVKELERAPAMPGSPVKELEPAPAMLGSPVKELEPGYLILMPGLRYLMEQLTMELVKRTGVEKEVAEDKIKEEWAAMTFEEQNNWNHIKKQMEVEVEATQGDSPSTAGVPDNMQVNM